MNDTLTLGAARADYYEHNHFGADGGDALAWVPMKMMGLTILKIPNTDGRRKAVRFHDLHHVLTGYDTDWRGEAEISAWELASGCLRWPAATILDLFGLAIGLALAPRRIVRAWARGRHTRNLYGEDGVEHLLPRTVGEMRAKLGLAGDAPRVRVRDIVAVLAIGLPVLAAMLAPLFVALYFII
jgi:hypothetical protein